MNLGLGWNKLLSLAELRKSYLDKEDALNVNLKLFLLPNILPLSKYYDIAIRQCYYVFDLFFIFTRILYFRQNWFY